ncbi:MAG: AAA family ATPase [Clostridia bacterium]|nr:AAA family ATPase [Clostridia bacterium]
MFYGRENELRIISEALNKPYCFVMVYGKRRVGKTTLLLHALDSDEAKTIYYECAETSMANNVDKFLFTLKDCGVIDYDIVMRDFDDVFRFLDRLNVTLNIVIDEYQYLRDLDSGCDSIFQKVADGSLGHIRLFICGSHVGMMRDLTNSSNPLYGRFSDIIELGEWDYRESACLYPELCAYDKVALYAVFGGSPYIVSKIEGKKTLRENIVDLYLKKDAVAFSYVDKLIMTTSSQRPAVISVLQALGNGKNKFSEIGDKSHISDNATLSKTLNLAISLHLIKKEYPINKLGDSKKAWYEIDDNVVRFFYAFIYGRCSMLEKIGPELFYDSYIEPGLTEYVSRRFEDICRTYFSLLCKHGMMSGVKAIGTYYYDCPANKKNGEFDVVIEKNLGYDIYEVKYLSSKMKRQTMIDKTEKVRAIKGLAVDVVGFISVNGFEDDCAGSLIDGEDLYK